MIGNRDRNLLTTETLKGLPHQKLTRIWDSGTVEIPASHLNNDIFREVFDQGWDDDIVLTNKPAGFQRCDDI